MPEHDNTTRRGLIKSSVLGLLPVLLPNIGFSNETGKQGNDKNILHDRYPAIQLDIVSDVVGAAHFNLEKLKKLVDTRPELANATWDFGFGDWESAIAAASHVGRPDIVAYLFSKGAVPTIFTHAMLGNVDIVKAMIEASPGIQKCLGPHGISLLQHAKIGVSAENGNPTGCRQLVDYLERLGDADGRKYLSMEEEEQQKYLGDYIYDTATGEGFTVKLNMRKMLSLGKRGKSGGTLYKTGEHSFAYNGAVSVAISFTMKDDKAHTLTITEPEFSVTAARQ